MLIDNFKLVEAGRLREPTLLDLLGCGPYPARNPAQNLADLRAQIAANEKGAQELRADGRAVRRATPWRATCGMCRTMPRSACAA